MNSLWNYFKKFSIIIPGTLLLLAVSSVTAMGSIVSADSIRAAVKSAVEQAAGNEGLDIDVSVPYIVNVMVNDVDFPRMRIIVPSLASPKSRIPVKVEFRDSTGEIVRKITCITRIKSFARVAVAGVDIKRGDPIDINDVVMKNIDITGKKNFYNSISELEGMQAKRTIKEGTILTANNIEGVPVIQKGDKVIIKVQVGSVVVHTEGTAREDGGLNENIRVYSRMTKKTLQCTVMNEQTVHVNN